MGLIDVQQLETQMYLGGWQPAGDAERIVDIEPATGEPLLEVPRGTEDTVDRAVRTAALAQPGWAEQPFVVRAEVFATAAALIDEHHDELRTWIVRECGGTIAKAEIELALVKGECTHAAAMLQQPLGELLPTTEPGRRSQVRRRPYGVVGVISPWNFPGELTMRSVAPALAVGNAVVHKPASDTPVAGGLLWARLLEEAGLPEGLLHVVPGRGSEIGSALVEHEGVGMLSFTGSTSVGAGIGEQAGRTITPVALELGGDNAYVVLDDVDVERAAQGGAYGTWIHQGQVCMAIGRHLVHESIVDDYVDRLVAVAESLRVGDANQDPDVQLGPVTNAGQLDTVVEIVEGSVEQGARLRTGGERLGGLFYAPTVIDQVTRDMPAFQREHFGPVAVVSTFADDDEAVELVGATEYGFVAGVAGGDLGRTRRVADRLDVGMVHVNDQPVNDEAVAPFGGRHASGLGRFGGFANWDEFTWLQWVTERDEVPARSLGGAPREDTA